MMIRAGVIGYPISHSKSPYIHGYWLKKYGIDGEYKAYEIRPETLETDIHDLVHAGVSGFNVTLPHKQNMMRLCQTLTDEARLIGAVNTVTVLKNGDLHGDNTDAFGFTQNLEKTIPGFDWTKKTATVIGAGGAARAVLYALSQKAVPEVRITNRTQESAENLARLYHATPFEWKDRDKSVSGADLIINTTSLGMKGQNPLDIDLSGIQESTVVYDIVYTPLITPFLHQAQNEGARIVTGIGMLLHQARPGFHAWFGQTPTVTDELENLILGV